MLSGHGEEALPGEPPNHQGTGGLPPGPSLTSWQPVMTPVTPGSAPLGPEIPAALPVGPSAQRSQQGSTHPGPQPLGQWASRSCFPTTAPASVHSVYK